MAKNFASGPMPQDTGGSRMSAGQAELQPEEESDAIQRDRANRIDEFYRAASEPGARPPCMDLINLMLADLQRPGARYVVYLQKWQEIGRIVKPAAIPIFILWSFCPRAAPTNRPIG